MKLLIVTQAIDTQHPILGFFHRWVEEFAKHCEQVNVIALEVGEYDLPDNVTVHSLGKETKPASTLTYAWRLNKLSWQLRHDYDRVFVHMNPEYVLAVGCLWRLLRKTVSLWYTHGTVSRNLRLAEKVVDRIFTASETGCRLTSKKVVITGHGIDTEHFRPLPGVNKDLDLITVGRIAPVKDLKTLVDVLEEVREQHDVSLTVVGQAVTETEKSYEEELKNYVDSKGLSDAVHFYGSCPQAELPQLLNRAKVFVSAAKNGSLDKVFLEAMACGLSVATNAPGVDGLSSIQGRIRSATDFSKYISSILENKYFQKYTNSEARQEVQKNHSLHILITKIVSM